MRAAWILALCGAVFGAAAAAQAAVPPLRLCADPSNLPFSSSTAATPGLYVEIGQAVAAALGRPFEAVWSQSYFGKRNLRTTLLAGQCDLAVGLPSTSEFMGPRLVYTRPILQLGYAIVVPNGTELRALDDLKGRRVIVQFASPPQSLLASRSDIMSLTAMDPEEAMRRLAAGEADAAFIWGPSAGYLNHTALKDAYEVIPVDAPQMQWQASIGFSSKQAALRDEVDAVLPQLHARIEALQTKYLVAQRPTIVLADSGSKPPIVTPGAEAAAPTAAAAPPPASQGDAKLGKEIFDGTCAHCHGPNAIVADRKINLRLLHHKYGDQMDEVFFTTVTNGRPSKGMPTWKSVFTREDFVNILAYLKTVQEP